MRTSRILIALLPLLTGFASLPAAADVSLRIADAGGEESRIYVNAGRCRIEAAGMSGFAVIDTRNHSLVYVDPAKQEYSTLSEAQLRERLDQMDKVRESLGPHMETLRSGLQALPAEQRAMFEQFMAGKAAPGAGAPVQIVADKSVQQFAGIACTHHRLVQGQRQVGDACLLQHAGGIVSSGDFSTLSTALGLARELSGRMGGLLSKAGNKTVLLTSNVSGIPLALRDFDSGESFRVVEASPARLDEALFSDYRKYRQTEAPALPGLF
jgi:hypothetical protein